MYFSREETLCSIFCFYKNLNHRKLSYDSMLITDSKEQILEALLTGEDLVSDLQADIL